jgi:hypothetical protein
VIREIEIWRVAMLMVNRYADRAGANSFQRAEQLAAEGDHAGAAIWRRIAANLTFGGAVSRSPGRVLGLPALAIYLRQGIFFGPLAIRR